MEDLVENLHSEFWIDTTQKKILKNGLTLVHTSAIQSDLCSIQYYIKTGSIHEEKFLGSGISHFLEHMVFKGTKSYTGEEITNKCQEIGGTQNAYTSFDRTVYFIDAPLNTFQSALKILTEMVFYPTFPEEEFEVEKEVILREISMNEDDPDRELSQKLFSLAYKSHPYRLPVIGKKSAFLNLSRRNLIEYHQKRYVPENTILAIGGNISKEEMDLVIQKLESIPSQTIQPISIAPEKTQIAYREHYLEKDLNLTRAGLAFQIPSLLDKDTANLDVLSSILGQGQNSLFWNKLRNDKSIVYQIDAQSWSPLDGNGLFFISFICDHNKENDVLSEIRLICDELDQNNQLAERIGRAKKQVIMSEIRSRKTISGLTSKIGNSEFSYGTTNYTLEYLSNLELVNEKTLLKTAQKYLIQKKATLVIMGNQSENALSKRNSLSSTKCIPEVTRFKNSNHFIRLQDNALPLTHFTLATKGGLFSEEIGKNGISSLFANLLSKDTEKMTSESISDIVDKYSLSWSPFSGKNSLGISAECIISDAPVVIELLCNALKNLNMGQKRLVIEKNAQIASLMEQKDEIFEVGNLALHKNFFQDHPLGKNPLGTVEDLQKIDLEDLNNYKNHCLQNQNWVLSVGGTIPNEEVLEPLLRILQDFKAPTEHLIDDKPQSNTCKTSEQIDFDRKQTVVFQAFSTPGIQEEDFIVADLIEEYLGSSAGRLFKVIREDNGLAYYTGVARTLGLKSGMLYFYAGTEKKHSDKIFEIFHNEINRISNEDFDNNSIEKCKNSLKIGKLKSVQTIQNKVTQSALNCLYNMPVDDWTSYPKKVDSITSRQISDFSKKYFFGQKTVCLTIGQ
tara:strand:+ start:1193 stop:3736 length:2544 start_codon:yes stop_codon:yes gene_type:complete